MIKCNVLQNNSRVALGMKLSTYVTKVMVKKILLITVGIQTSLQRRQATHCCSIHKAYSCDSSEMHQKQQDL